MMRQLFEVVATTDEHRNTLFNYTSTELSRELNNLWEFGGSLVHGRDQLRRVDVLEYTSPIFTSPISNKSHNSNTSKCVQATQAVWDHLTYAYLVENTRMYDIFRRLIVEFRNGERLGPLTPKAVQWLQTTEELFFTQKHSIGFVSPVGSVGSPDPDAAHRNAYYRMFGFDLNHGYDDGRAVSFTKPTNSNRDFGATLESLLHEVWKGITNAENTSGTKDTDNSQIGNLGLRLHQMLTERKSPGKIVREEYWYVCMMSWLHMAIEFPNSPIVAAMSADASSAEERLRRLGQVVGLPPHARTSAFLLLARNCSVLMRESEYGLYTSSSSAQRLYVAPVRNMMADIISQYSIATGKDLKARQVSVAGSRA